METNSTTACSSINEEQSVVVHSNVYGENSRKPEPDLALPPTEEKPSTKGADQYSPTLTENSINNERSSLLIEEKCWDTESGVNPICDNQDKVVGLNEKINDAKENDLVQQEGYIAMSENGEHCVFIPAEQVEEDILMRATSDTRVILTPKQENEIEDSGHLIDDARRSQPHQMENHFQQIKQEAPAVQTAMPTITLTKHDSLGHPTRFHQEQNAMMMNFHQGQTDPDQTSQLPVHNQYNPSMPLHHHFSSPRRGNRQQMSTQSVPYSSHALSNRATYPNINSVIHMPQNQVHFNSGLTMQNYGQLPPISTLQPGAVENQTLSHPPMNSTVHPQTSIIAGGSGDTVIYSSPVKSEHNYNQYMMKAPIMTTISPLKTDLVIQNNDPISSGEEQSVSPLYRMDGRPSQGLVQQVLHVFKICKKTEMQPCEVYHELTKLYPLYTTYHGQKKKSWMSSVRHALTHPAFKSRRADENKNESHRKGCFWSINDNYNPQAPLPRRRRKVQRKVNYSNNQQVQYMMMPMAMSNEQMMGPQNATAFSSMMPGNVMPAYIMPQNNNAHSFGDGGNQQHPALNIMQPQPMMVPPFGNVANNGNMAHFGQFGGNYQNQGMNISFMEQMKAAENPMKKHNHIVSPAQIAPQPLGLCPYIHHDNDGMQKVQQKPESETMPTAVSSSTCAYVVQDSDKRKDEPSSASSTNQSLIERQPNESIPPNNQESCSLQPQVTPKIIDCQHTSSDNATQPTEIVNKTQPATEQL